MMTFGFFICDTIGFLQVMNLAKIAINIIRFLVPILIIVFMIKDLVKNVINPNNKEGMKSITNRLIAAIIVFLVPTIIDLLINLINDATDNEYSTNYKLSSCYVNANKSCIQNIRNYINCEGVSTNEISNCRAYRQCNNYTVSSSCNVKTEEIEECKITYKESKYTKFRR